MPVRDRDPFVAVAATLNAVTHTDYKSSYLEVYIAIFSRAGTSPAVDNYCTAFPSTETIAEKFQHSRQTVIDATPWLEANGYLFKERRQRASNLYTIVLRRQQFLETRRTKGLDKAKAEYKAWIQHQIATARAKMQPPRSSGPTPRSKIKESSGPDIKNEPDWPEVTLAVTSGAPSQKSQPLHHDLDPPKILTTPKDQDPLEPELPLPLFRRKIFD